MRRWLARSGMLALAVYAAAAPVRAHAEGEVPEAAWFRRADEAEPEPAPGPESPSVWQELAEGFRLDPPDSDLVEVFARDYARRGFLDSAGRRALPWLHVVMDEIEARGLPMELALLPFVESAFQPHARSPVGAHGPWQFMPATGRQYGLAMDRLRDERRSWQGSTRAALDYLQALQQMFGGDLLLAMAAYNAGEGRVARALEKAQALGLPPRLESLRLPRETREYVPRVFALRRLLENPAAYGVTLPGDVGAVVLMTVAVERDMDVETAARLAGVPVSQLRLWNPALQGPMIVAVAHPELLLPVETAFRFADGLAESRQPLASWSLQRLARPMSAEDAARRWRVSASQVRAANPLPVGHRYRQGASLFIPRRATTATTADQVTDSVLATEPAYRRTVVRAQARDTPVRLAKRYGVAARDVVKWNPRLANAPLRKGTKVVLLLPLA